MLPRSVQFWMTFQGSRRRPILEGSVGVVGEIGRRRRRHVVITTSRVSLGLSGSLFRGEGGRKGGQKGEFLLNPGSAVFHHARVLEGSRCRETVSGHGC